VRQLWEEQPGLHRGYLVDVLTAVAVACALILGGRARTVAVAWQTLNESGGPVVWGAVFACVAGLLVAATFVSGRAMMAALWVTAVPYALIGSWFLHGALTEPSASFLGTILCFRAAIMHLSRGDAYRAGPAGPGP
jgi:hypothetical protein